MKKTKWLQKLNAPDHCPVCGFEISAQQKQKIHITRFSTYECPGCQAGLYLKWGWVMSIYTAVWMLVVFITGQIFKDSYVARRLSLLIILILSCGGIIAFIMPFLTIKVKKE